MDLLETCGGGGGMRGSWVVVAEIGTRISSSSRYNQTGQGQDRTGVRGGDKEERVRWVGACGAQGGGGGGGLGFPLSRRGGLGWLAFAALWGLCLSLPACNMEKTLALLLLLMHVTWADEVKKRETMVFGFWSLAKSVVWSYGTRKESNT